MYSNKLMPFQEAQNLIDANVSKLPVTSIPLVKAVSHTISEDVVSPIDIPGFPSSIMDGIAIKISDLSGTDPWRLPVQTVIAAGDIRHTTLLKNHAVKIMTGACLPEGADTVIPVEEIDFDSGEVIIRKCPPAGDFVRPVGDDINKGDQLYKTADLLSPIDIGILSSIGMTEVKVTAKPSIALLSTGPEIVDPGEKLHHGQVYDSNLPLLTSLLTEHRHNVKSRIKISADEIDTLCRSIEQCLDMHDLCISTGGVSVGEFDLIPEAIIKLGGTILFHRVKTKPGRPVMVARIGNRWFAGLPGNPVSVLVGYHLFVRRIIARLQGLTFKPSGFQAVLNDDLPVSESRYHFIGTQIAREGDKLIAIPVKRQQSGRLSSVKDINGFIFAGEGPCVLSKGSVVYVEQL